MSSPKAKREAAESVFEKRRNAADKLSAEIADDRRKRLQSDALKTSRLRELRLAREAVDGKVERRPMAARPPSGRRA
jgi:hypothetical protein